jgi:uncharacterized coiled-coil protein SlyX
MSAIRQGQTIAELHELVEQQRVRIERLEAVHDAQVRRMDELTESAVLSDERGAVAVAQLELINSTRTWRLRSTLLRLGPLRRLLARRTPASDRSMTT